MGNYVLPRADEMMCDGPLPGLLELVPKRCVFGWLGESGEDAADAYYSGVAVAGGWLLVGAGSYIEMNQYS